MELIMGIHHDYKSKRGERAMAKQQKREAKFSDNTDKKEEEKLIKELKKAGLNNCLLYTSPSPRDNR